MADSKVSGLTADTSPTSDDLLYLIDDPGGTPTSKKSTSGNVIKKAHGLSDGIVKVASGVMTPASPSTDYAPPTTGSAILKGNGSGGFSSATSGTDYAPPTSGSSILKGNGSGGTTTATAGTDYYNPGGTDVAVTDGGTGSSTASGARTNLAAAASGTNSDITSMSAVSGTIGSPTAIDFTGISSPTYSTKRITYDTTLNQWVMYDNDSAVALNVGYENWYIALNNTGSTIANGAAVYISGASGGNPTIALAKADGVVAGASVGMGVTTESILNGATGKVTQLGLVNGLDTSALSAGAVYVSAVTAGALTNTAPTSPNYRMRVGFVGKVDATTGSILITPSTSEPGTGANNTLMGVNSSGVRTYLSTIQNIRIVPRVTTITSSATPTINTDNTDCVTITAQSAAIGSFTTNLTGTPNNFDRLTIRIKDDGTARAITWGASFEAKGASLPTTTVISKVLTVGFIYDTVTSKWGCVATAQEA